MAHRKVKKAARKQAKKLARRPVKRATAKPKPKVTRKAKAKAAPKPVKKAAPKPLKKRMPVKTRNVAKPKKKVMARKAPSRAAKTPARSVKPVTKAAAVQKAAPAPAAKPKAPASIKRTAVPSPPTLQRERRRLPEAEEDGQAFSDVSEDSRLLSSARAGHDELRSEMKKHTESSPAMTAGDVDAKWQDAYALGDEAPGGDNMTPDQDRVDDIGKALGIEYADDEELLGGDELVERDEHRWELDPASKEEDEDL